MACSATTSACLNAIRVGIPPLRDRPEDTASRRGGLLERSTPATVGTKAVLTAEVFAALRQHRRPGNVRNDNDDRRAAVSAPRAGFVRARHVLRSLGTVPLS